jgi:anti-anti-sigma regulatory factor
MKLRIDEEYGAMYILFEPGAQWKAKTFFPMVDAMYQQIKKRWEASPKLLVFDISNLEYIDSTFISLVIQTTRLTGEQRNVIISANAQNIDLLSLLGMDRFVDIYRSKEEWQQSTEPD